jgi:isopropylmalate/homocitrate/citramalate synthase
MNTNIYIENLFLENMEIDVDRIQKNPDTDIVIRIDDFGGKRGLTIREFVKSERYTGFTKAGTRIPAEQFKAFKQAINSINEKDLESTEQTKLTEKEPSEQKEGHSHKKAKPKKEDIEEEAF